jgi:hypothetical protein
MSTGRKRRKAARQWRLKMFALLSLSLFLAADEAAAKPAVESCPVALAQVITQAFDDFEARYSELGLLGAAPMPGRELLEPAEQEVATRAFDGAQLVSVAHAQPARSR